MLKKTFLPIQDINNQLQFDHRKKEKNNPAINLLFI